METRRKSLVMDPNDSLVTITICEKRFLISSKFLEFYRQQPGGPAGPPPRRGGRGGDGGGRGGGRRFRPY